MYRLLLIAVDVIPAALVLVPVFILLYPRVYSREIRKCAWGCLYCLYMAAVFSLVGIPNVTYFRPEVNLNLIPFAGMIRDLKNSILNVLLFVPLGFFLPLMWPRFRKILYADAFAFSFSLAIELLQMLTFRATDVNDLITNTAGAVLGFLAAKPLFKRYAAAEQGNISAVFLSLLSFAVMFFVHPFLSAAIWDALL